MIVIERAHVEAVRSAASPAGLHESLRGALRLEHATIPLYLTASFSIERRTDGTNDRVRSVLRSVVREEMLHFAIVANLINATGGDPMIDDGSVVPRFPGPLPMGVGDGLQVALGPATKAQIETFATIEEPDDPLAAGAGADTTTIGDLYRTVVERIRELGDPAFGRPRAPQVVSPWFPSDQLFAITDVESAARALEVVVEQGEGTLTSPFEAVGATGLAHYYQFRGIVEGHELVPDPAAPEGFSYSGAELALDETAVFPLVDEPSLERWTDRPEHLALATDFCRSYRRVMRGLQRAFSGEPQRLDTAIGAMFELRTAAMAMIEVADPDEPTKRMAPSWEYVPI